MTRSLRTKVRSVVASRIQREEVALKAHPLRGYLIIASTFVMAAVLPFFSEIWLWPIASGAFVVAALSQVAILVRLRLSERRRGQRHPPAW